MAKGDRPKPGSEHDASAATRPGGPKAPPKGKQMRPSGALKTGGKKGK